MQPLPLRKELLPKRGHSVTFNHRDRMRRSGVWNSVKALPSVSTPIDWSGSLQFPILGNDQYGDCYYAAALHQDQTWTGNSGTESSFNATKVDQDYLVLSGGDNGLSEDQITWAWKAPNTLASTPQVSILDFLNIDPNNTALMQSAIWYFGGVMFALSLSEAWYKNFDTGYTWDVPCKPDSELGHAVLINGSNVVSAGVFKFQSWATYGFITTAGVAACEPSAFIAFSLRWFNSSGLAPNGQTYSQLAALWTAAGGKSLPPSPFNPGPTPIPTPTPVPAPIPMPPPTPSVNLITIDLAAHAITTPAGFRHSWGPRGNGEIIIHPALETIVVPPNTTINDIKFPE